MLRRPKCGLVHYSGFLIYNYQEVTSTNALLMKAGYDGAKSGTVVQAKTQTAGKGSKGRSFYSPKGGLYFSVLIRPGAKVNASQLDNMQLICPELTPEDCTLITPMVACAVADGIEHYTGRPMEIKWVNDIYFRSKKVAGILTESAVDKYGDRYYVIGIGVNVNPPEDGFPEEFADNTTTLFDEETEMHVPVVIRNSILLHLGAHFQKLHSKVFLVDYRRRSNILNHPVNVIPLDGTQPYIAKAIAIDNQAHLVVKNSSGKEITLNAEDVKVLPNS